MRVSKLKDGSPDSIILATQTAQLFTATPRRLIFQFGAWRKEVTVEYSCDMPDDLIGVPQQLTAGFSIPDTLDYQVVFRDRTLNLGPVIAFVATAGKANLTEASLAKLECYFYNYASVQGLVYVCGANGFRPDTQTVEGFCYNPRSDGDCWSDGIFPYPGAVYRKTGFHNDIYNSLIGAIGNKIFNTYFFDKWELWQWLSCNPIFKESLPDTRLLSDLGELDTMLKRHDCVYLKRRDGARSQGIIRVHKSAGGYHFVYRLEGEIFKSTSAEAAAYIEELKKKGQYLIQQAISNMRYEERPFDLRVILQKNRYGHWQSSGIIARFGKRASIATNFTAAGYATTGVDALKAVYNLSEKEAFLKLQEILRLCIYACNYLNQCGGHYADLGIDVILDKDKKVWLLEINKLHDHRFPLIALNDSLMYHNVVTAPLAYAKYLAGFGSSQNLSGEVKV